MSDQRIENSNYVVFVLQAEQSRTYTLLKEPEGWEDDDLEIVRNKKYHGIVTQFTSGLKFRGYAKDFIKDAYALNGLNANLYLIKYVLRKGESYVAGEDVDNIKFKIRYRGIADFNTLKESDGSVEVNFNSDELEQLLKSHESDDLEIERTESVDGVELSEMELNTAIINGRELSGIGEHINEFDNQTSSLTRIPLFTIPSNFVTKGFKRHVEVTRMVQDYSDQLEWQANFFYDDLLEDVPELETKLQIDFDIDLRVRGTWSTGQNIPKIGLYVTFYAFTGNGYEENGRIGPLKIWDNNTYNTYQDTLTIDYGAIQNNEGLNIEFHALTAANELWVVDFPTENDFYADYSINTWNIKIKESTTYGANQNTHKFAFINEVASRLMETLTGERFKFYSKLFGRNVLRLPPSTGVITQYQDYDYVQDGEFGNVGLINGFFIRQFDNSMDLFRNITISPKTLIESLQATFNIGVGIEHSKKGQRLRFEKLKHFYRSEVVVILPNQVTKVKRKVESTMFYSGCSFGSDKGGDYEFGLGLDEPNLRTDFITPLRKTDKKYNKLSKIRSDDTGLEILRRQPAYLDETADMGGDDHLWYLDLKRNTEYIYERLRWEDNLEEEPQGVIDPNTYKNWRFTPKRVLTRHGWVLRAGMEQPINLSKEIIVSSTKSNTNLETTYIGGEPLSENSPIKVADLERPRVLPETITLTHDVDDDLMDWILGTTTVLIDGEEEDVPNWYFKFQWINENEAIETGYLKSLKPKKGVFEFLKANETMYGVDGQEDDSLPLTFSSNLIMNGHLTLRIGGEGFVDWGDGTTTPYSGESELYSHYFLNFTGTIKFYGTLTRLHSQTSTANLYHDINALPTEMLHYVNEGVNTTSGNINTLKEGLKTYWNIGLNTVSGDVADLPTTILTFVNGGNNTVTGDISDTPSISDMIFWNCLGTNTISDYTSGVSWNSGVYLVQHLPTTGSGLSATEVDNMLIDLESSGMNIGIINLAGENAARTSASDSAVTALQLLGVSVTTN